MKSVLFLRNENVPATPFARLSAAAARKQAPLLPDKYTITCALRDRLSSDGFHLELGPDSALLESGGVLGLFAGVGRFLRETDDLSTRTINYTPARPLVGTYFATHFDNYYMKADFTEIARYVEELALWGQNYLIVWFDMHSYTGMDDPKAQPVIERLRAILQDAKGIGMKIGLTTLANEGFSTTPEELKADWWVQNGYTSPPGGHYHVEVCPSRPGGMELILKNRRAMLERFADLDLDTVNAWTYDQGGCTCAGCAPYGANGYLKILPPLRKLYAELIPHAEPTFAGWYFDHFIPGEWESVYRAGEKKPELFAGYPYIAGIYLRGIRHMGVTPPEKLLRGEGPAKTGTLGFPEISMHGCTPWGGFGANPYPGILQEEWDAVGHTQAGEWSYSEGIYEDMNKAIILGLYSGQYHSAMDVVRDYMKLEFGPEAVGEMLELIPLLEETLPRKRIGEEQRFLLTHPERVFEIRDRIEALDRTLSPTVRQSWRWRVFYIRAMADATLLEDGGYILERTEQYLDELETIYHTDKDTLSFVSPATRKNLRKALTEGNI